MRNANGGDKSLISDKIKTITSHRVEKGQSTLAQCYTLQ